VILAFCDEAVSRGGGRKLGETLLWCEPFEYLSRTSVQPVRCEVKVVGSDAGEGLAPGEILAE